MTVAPRKAAARAELQQLFAQLPAKAVVYCDPPYVPLSKTASFTSYAKNSFTFDDQAELANLAEAAQAAGHTVVTWSG